MKIRNHLTTILSVGILTSSGFAIAKDIPYHPDSPYHQPDYYKNEGNLLFKIRGFYALADGKQQKFPAPTNANAKSLGPLIKNGMGLDAATVFFFADHFAAEMSVGVIYYKVKGSTISNVFNNYGQRSATNDGSNNANKKKTFSIPASLTLQYHIAPYGAIRPYVGGGFHGTYMSDQSKTFKISHNYGGVLQAGVDLIGQDDMLINLDVRQFLSNTKVSYKNTYLNTASDVSGKLKLNPLLVSVGFGIKM